MNIRKTPHSKTLDFELPFSTLAFQSLWYIPRMLPTHWIHSFSDDFSLVEVPFDSSPGWPFFPSCPVILLGIKCVFISSSFKCFCATFYLFSYLKTVDVFPASCLCWFSLRLDSCIILFWTFSCVMTSFLEGFNLFFCVHKFGLCVMGVPGGPNSLPFFILISQLSGFQFNHYTEGIAIQECWLYVRVSVPTPALWRLKALSFPCGHLNTSY